MSFFAAAAAAAFAFVSVAGFALQGSCTSTGGAVVLGALCFLVAEGGDASGSAVFAFFCFFSAMRAARLDTFPETVCSVGCGDGLDAVPFFVSSLFELTLLIRRRLLPAVVDVERGVAVSAEAVTPVRKSTRLADIAMRASLRSNERKVCTLVLLHKWQRIVHYYENTLEYDVLMSCVDVMC